LIYINGPNNLLVLKVLYWEALLFLRRN